MTTRTYLTLALALALTSMLRGATAVNVCGVEFPPETAMISMSSNLTCNGTSIPSMASLTQLTTVYLHHNLLMGTIPDFSANLLLDGVAVHGNDLTGTIPDFSANTMLRSLYASSNRLTGTIPDFSNNTMLMYLDFHNNQLTGSVPDFSANNMLIYLDLDDNQLTGLMPDLTSHNMLQFLYLASNRWACPLHNYAYVRTNDFVFVECFVPTTAATLVPTADVTQMAFPDMAMVQFKGTKAYSGATTSVSECRMECAQRPQCVAGTRWESGWCTAWSHVTAVVPADKAVSWIAAGTDACLPQVTDAYSLPYAPSGATTSRPCEMGATGTRVFECDANLQWQEDASACEYECKCRADLAAMEHRLENVVMLQFDTLRSDLGL